MTMSSKLKQNGKGSVSDQCQTPAYGTDTIAPWLNPAWTIVSAVATFGIVAGLGYLISGLFL